MEKQRQLYDVDTIAIWTPNDNADASLTSSSNASFPTSGNLQQQLDEFDKDAKRKLARWKQWFLRRVAANISPLFLTTTVPSGIASTLTPIKSPWQIALSPDSHFLAVNHEDKIEFRTLNSSYQIVHSVWGATSQQDLYPKWRRIAWSFDSKLVARSFSNGTVEIIDTKGRLIGSILPKIQQQDAPVEDEGVSSGGTSQLFVEPLCYLGFVNTRKSKNEDGFGVKFNGHNYAYELITITYDGALRSYLFNTPEALGQSDSTPTSPLEDYPKRKNLQHRRSLLATQSLLTPRQSSWAREGYSDPGFFCPYHTFTFKDTFRTVACASIDEHNGILCVGGTPHQSKEPADNSGTQAGVQFWTIERDSPYYQRYNTDGQLQSSVDSVLDRTPQASDAIRYPTGLSAIGPTLQKLFERDVYLTNHSVHTIVVHEKYGALSLDSSGSLTSWTLSKERGGVLKMTWNSEHLNYYARSEEHSTLSFQEFQELVKEYQSNGTSTHLIGVANGRCVSMRFWAEDAILLGYESGAMIVLQIPELINILGQEPKVFASCLEFTNSGFSAHDEQVFVIEEITRMIRARVVGDRWIMMTDQEDKAMGEPTEQEIAQMMGNERLLFKWIAQLTKYFGSKDADERRAKLQRLILVPKRTLSLYRMLRVPPEELLYRKLEGRDYSSALAIATTYELDTDVVYQYQWKQLSHISADVVSNLLDKITDKQWVLANCLESVTEDHEGIRTLLEYGLQLTDSLMDDIIRRYELGTEVKIDWIRAAASGEPMRAKTSELLLAVQLAEREMLWCKYRWYFLKYLNRLSTFTELTIMEKQWRTREEARISRLLSKHPKTKDPLDPLGILYDDAADQRTPPLPLLTGSYNTFKDMDLSALARIYAEAEFIEGVRILFTRHNRETWPWRMTTLNRIPETCPTEAYRGLLPRLDPATRVEKPWAPDHPWRELDWAEIPELRTLVFGSADHEMDAYLHQQALALEERKAAHGGNEAVSLDMVAIKQEAEEILPSPLPFPASGEDLSHWYIDRALEIDRNAGQIIEQRRLIQYGTDNYIPLLETISEDLEILYKLLYEIKPDNRRPEAKAMWADTVQDLSLEQFSLMNPMEVVQLCLGMSDEHTIVQDIRRLVLPYLTVVIPRRWQRSDPVHVPGQGLPAGQDSQNPMSYLYAFLLRQSPNHLSWVGAVIQASKPVYEPDERIISNDMELSWLTMSCMYGCRTVDEWKVMSDMIVCLPMFEQTEDVDETIDKVRRAELRKNIFVTFGSDLNTSSAPAQDRSRISQQLDPLNMYPAFVKYAPTQGLMQHALDTLEQNLTAAETLARYDLPVQLSWFLENSDSEASQLQMVTKMARLASGGPERMGERFESDDEWMLLLEDLIRLRGGEKGGGVLGRVSEQDIYREYLAGVLSCGKFELARAILFPPGMLPPVRLATAEKLVIDCSNEMFNNATSGNRHQGLMKMAYDCLKVLPETTNIRKEMDLIEATNFMTSTYNLTAPGSSTTILPFQIRATENRLSLVRRLIMSQENAYRDHAAMLELAIKVTGIGQKKTLRQQIEIQVVGMLIEAALKEKNHVFAIQQAERLMELLRTSGALDMNADGSPRMRRVVKSNSFVTGGGGNSEDSASTPSRPDSPSSLSSRPGSRAGTSSGPSTAAHGPSLQGLGDPDARNPWEIFVQVATESVGREYSKRMAVAGYALACCPADKIESVLELWRSLEMESVHAPVPEVDPRRGVAGFMSTMIDRSSSGSNGMSAPGLGYGTGYNPNNVIVSGAGTLGGGGGPLAEIIGRVGTNKSNSTYHDHTRREQSMNSHAEQEGGRKRDKLKSLVSSIWAQ
ncbi:secretory pathway protein Sec39-domain-containing protein [Gamsiella multidivaricata]|uniref:secretory pathway protein Sec39-domain-containing protein n=1 Tax=Gamsiella multidivaricata TaxID=101098 RepID=UPI002220E836|nr:secretory pathway protein Sec39-domain-containing protein [Gamsiella multidivaricata]KAI7818637.1 secretory pathway protein Sec39-domain-containing protein [Gamsiella multidivaricata]